MNAALVAVFSLLIFGVGYKFYGDFMYNRVMKMDPGRYTPAHELRDGVDYVPTNRWVLFGHHFASISGLGPIVGPAIAVIWGWLPALLWIVFGTLLIGAVHDFTIMGVSVRNQGRSIGDVAAGAISERSQLLFLFLIFFLITLAMGVFAYIIAVLFSELYPATVVPVLGIMVLAVVIGASVRAGKMTLLTGSIVGIILLGLLIWHSLSIEVVKPGAVAKALLVPVLPGQSLEIPVPGVDGWIYLIMIYAYVASVLPVWLLLQPRDYLNSYLLYAGLGGLYLGLFLIMPSISAPMVTDAQAPVQKSIESIKPGMVATQTIQGPEGDVIVSHGSEITKSAKESMERAGTASIAVQTAPDLPPLFPILFITVACGAISGFHSLVSSGTTAKQLDSEEDGKMVGFGGMVAEGILALIVMLSCVAGLGGFEAWHSHYWSWSAASGLGAKLGAFIDGGAAFISSLGISLRAGKIFISLTAVSFAMTTLDSGTRLLRYNIEEISQTFSEAETGFTGVNRWTSSLLAVIAIGFFALLKVPVQSGGEIVYQPAGIFLWVLFGASNQLLAGLGLLTVTVYLYKRRRPVIYTLLPMIFMIIVTVSALVGQFFKQMPLVFREPVARTLGLDPMTDSPGSWVIFLIVILISILAGWFIVESVQTYRHFSPKEPRVPDQEAPQNV